MKHTHTNKTHKTKHLRFLGILDFKTYNILLPEGSHIRIGVTKGVKTKLRRDDSDFS